MESPVDSTEAEIYAKREKIYPREVHGIFRSLRTLGVVVLLGLFYGIAWLPWDGHQAVLFDLPARKFYVFGLTFWPQDFFYFAWLLVIAALSLFFFTALAGRLWCGYACPQTVWTDVFLWIDPFPNVRPQTGEFQDTAPGRCRFASLLIRQRINDERNQMFALFNRQGLYALLDLL